MISNKFLEEFYENVILPKYSDNLDLSNIKWIDHGKISDAYSFAHYFICNNKEFVLLYENFPGNTYFDDGLSHDIIKCGDKTNIELKFSDNKEIDNIAGWFTLYREKDSK